jgi:hypothetical protein
MRGDPQPSYSASPPFDSGYRDQEGYESRRKAHLQTFLANILLKL